MAHTLLGTRGQLTLPDEVLELTHAQPGDTVVVEVIDPDTITLKIDRGNLQDDAARSEDKPIGIADLIEGYGDRPVKDDDLPILTLEQMFERYRIEGPIDLKADREAMADEMAKDVFGERPDRFPD